MPESKRFLLRLNPRLFDALHRWADDDLRSINAQIEYLLTDQARRAGRLPRHSGRRPPPDAAADESADPDPAAVSTSAAGKRMGPVSGVVLEHGDERNLRRWRHDSGLRRRRGDAHGRRRLHLEMTSAVYWMCLTSAM